MNDKNRLSSEQALDNYFLDLLVEPWDSQDPASVHSVDHNDAPTAAPFDFDKLSGDLVKSSDAPEKQSDSPDTLSLLSDSDGGYGAMAADVGRPSKGSQASGWVPQSEPVAKLQSKLNDSPLATVVLDNEPPELQNVQRLLSQMDRPQEDIQPERDEQVATHAEAEFQAVAQDDDTASELKVAPELKVALDPEVSPDIEPVALEEQQVVLKPEVSISLQAQEGGDEPPVQWHQRGSEQAFQALFFDVNGVTFAVALNELGGIHQMGELNHLLGRPAWYLGLLTNREQQFDVVDTARWVMPEKLDTDEYQENYRYIVMLGESQWGLACDKLLGTETLTEQSVRWREKAGKRPWLAGMVKEKMCALIHVNALISMLNEGLDVKGIM